MVALILVFTAISLYIGFKVKKKNKLELQEIKEKQIIEAKIKAAENFKKKIWMAKRLK